MRELAHAGVVVIVLAATGQGTAQPQGDPPNIVFILADDMGWGDLGCFGNLRLETPRLDQLAFEGTRFTRFYTASPVCSPTRAAFLTGRFPSELAIHTAITCSSEINESRAVPDWLDPSIPTITSLLNDAGYAVGLFGKWHLGGVPDSPPPDAYGIDDHVTIMSTGPGFPGEGQEFFWTNSTEYMVDEAIEFIEQNSGTPFFLTVATVIPHSTLNPTPEQLEVYADLAPGPGHGGEPMNWTGAWQIYYSSVTAMDAQIGRLLDRLDQLGLTDDTLVVFTSDNGPTDPYSRTSSHSGVGTPGPMRGRKWSLYEGGVRMPLIVRWPGRVPAGAVDNESVIGMVDFMPTFLTLTGTPLPPSIGNDGAWLEDVTGIPSVRPFGGVADEAVGPFLDGEDVSDALLGTPRPRSGPLFWEYRFSQTAVDYLHRSPLLAILDGDWKLLINPDLSRVELFDVAVDTWEMHNRADDHPEIVQQLSAMALAWQASLPPGPYWSLAGYNTYPWPQPTAP